MRKHESEYLQKIEVELLSQRCMRWSLLAITLAMLNLCPAYAADSSAREDEVKSVLLFNLVRFVEWPTNVFATPDAPIVLGIWGPDPFGSALDEAIQGETINGHPIVARRCDYLIEATNCHLLFVNLPHKDQTRSIIAALADLPILTVSEEEDFLELGGIVRLSRSDEGQIRLHLNLRAARARALVISTKLLRVARIEEGG